MTENRSSVPNLWLLCSILLVFELLIGLFNLAYLHSDRLSNEGWIRRQESGATPNQTQSAPNPKGLSLGLETRRLIKYQLNLDREGNVVTWYSSALGMVAALAAFALF